MGVVREEWCEASPAARSGKLSIAGPILKTWRRGSHPDTRSPRVDEPNAAQQSDDEVRKTRHGRRAGCKVSERRTVAGESGGVASRGALL